MHAIAVETRNADRTTSAGREIPPPAPKPPAVGGFGDLDTSVRLRAAIAKLSRRLRHTAAGSELTPTDISVLNTIVRRGPLRLAELAAIEAINPTMLSRIAGRLTSRGLIRRIPDPDDRRSARLAATAAGSRMRERIHRERAATLQAPIAGLSARQRSALERALPVLEELAGRLGERR